MSENSQDYQVTTDVPVEQVTHTDVANAIDEKLIEQTAAATLNSNDIESEQKAAESDEKVEESSEQDDQFASKFAALSRKEKDLRSREKQMEDKIAKFEARMAELEAPKVEEETKEPELPLEYRLKKNPLQTLEEMGLSYEKLTELALNDGNLTTDMQMKLMREEIETDFRSKYETLENKMLEKEKAEEEANYNETIASFKTDINTTINESEEYELIQANEAYDLVYDVIEQFYGENQRILDTKEAADQVEQYLEEELKKVLEKSKKFGNWKSDANKPVASTVRQSPTLSNSLSVSGSSETADKLLSREESLAKLAPLIKWED